MSAEKRAGIEEKCRKIKTGKQMIVDPVLSAGTSTFEYRTFSSVRFSSVTQSCLTLCIPMDSSKPGVISLPKWSMQMNAAATAKSFQLCPTLCDPIDVSPSGSPIPGILQARTLEWVAISFSNAWKSKVKVKSLSRVQLLVTPWTAAYQAPLSTGFSRQESWSGVPMPSLSSLTSKLANMVKSLTLQFLTE